MSKLVSLSEDDVRLLVYAMNIIHEMLDPGGLFGSANRDVDGILRAKYVALRHRIEAKDAIECPVMSCSECHGGGKVFAVSASKGAGGWIICTMCLGAGELPVCDACGGTGYRHDLNPKYASLQHRCTRCNGTGTTARKT